MKEKEIEQLFNDGLGNLEADVNPNAWANIQQGLKSPAEPTPAITSAAKGGLFNYTGLLLTVAAAGIITAVYFGTKKYDKGAGQPLASTQVVKEQPSTSVEVTEQPIASEIQTSNNSSQKPAATSTGKQSSNSAVKKNTVAEPKQNANQSVSAPVNNAQTTTETKPVAIDNHSSQKVSVPASVTDNVQKPAIPSEAKQTTAAKENSGKDVVLDKPDLKVYMPSGFRPEVDPQFGITGEDVKEFVMTIWDSKGNIVFNSSEPNQTWDGKLKNGELAPDGKYKVAGQVIDFSGVAHPKNGPLTIQR